MYKRLPALRKKELIQKIRNGAHVSAVCREEGISRTILYKWIKAYNAAARRSKSHVLKPNNPGGKKHHRYTIYKKQKKILKTAIKTPYLSLADIAKANNISAHGAWNVLKRHNLNTRQFREAYVLRNGKSLVKEYSVNEKLAIIRRMRAGERVSSLCRECGVSRTILYRWLKRYEENQESASLFSMRPRNEKHWRYVQDAPDIILEIIVADPQLSPVKIAQKITEKIGKQILGAHGVYNFLKKHRLNTVEFRIRYANQQGKSLQKHAVQTEISLPAFSFDRFISFVPPPLRNSAGIIRNFIPLSLLGIGLISLIVFWARLIFDTNGIGSQIGIFFSFSALLFGMFFFLYSLKSYFMISIVLSFSRHEDEKDYDQKSFLDSVLSMFGIRIIREKVEKKQVLNGAGLMPDLSKIRLKRHPFVSIHLAMYNEKRVIDRLLTAATSMDYDNYEVIVADDSTDPEAIALLAKWKDHPKVTILHRSSRDGYKGQALQNALTHTNPKAEFIMVFDADFIPYPDSATSFLKYFQSVIGSLESQVIQKSPIAAVQGYQWHVLNKSENWITRGVRSEYAGSYVVERSSIEVYGGLKQISGSVYMIRRDVVEKIGWGRSITEDFEFTLKLYNDGYKVVYTPYVQAPSEAVSTVKRIIRQRMRWAEGHSFNVKKMFWNLLQNPKLTFPEKFEFVYLTPYYLQSAFFIAGTLCWFIAEAVFRVRLPFWTAVWGWSLIFTNMFALPLMNLVGLFLEESTEKDYLGLLSFVGLTYVVAPFQGYAAIKGFLEKEEGPWFRTPKTGRITDTFIPGHFYRYVKGFFGIKQTLSNPIQNIASGFGIHPYLALATANNQFNQFAIKPVKKMRWMGKSILAILLICAIMLNYLSFFTPKSYAAAPNPTIEQQINIIDQTITSTTTLTGGATGLIMLDTSKYTGATYYFDVVASVTSGTGSVTLTYNAGTGTTPSGGTTLVNTVSSTTNPAWSRVSFGTVPSGAQLAYISAVSGTGISVKDARLVIVQTSSTGITNTETQIDVEANTTTTATTATIALGERNFLYTAANRDNVANIYFEATIANSNSRNSTTAGLYPLSSTCGTAVGAVVTTGPTVSLVRSSAITLTDAYTYMVCLSSSNSKYTASLINAHIIIDQSASTGVITKAEIYDQYNATTTNVTSTSWTEIYDNNHYDPANWAGGTFSYFLRGSKPNGGFVSGVGGELQLYDVATSSAVANSILYTGICLNGSNCLETSPQIYLSNSTVDYDIQEEMTSTLSSGGASVWLLIVVTNLSTPESLLIFLPILLFLPKIVQVILEIRRRRQKGQRWTIVWQYIRRDMQHEKDKWLGKFYTRERPPN